MITVLAGGVGAARFLRGLLRVVEPHRVAAIVNTADDVVMHGLNISPDLDTVVYTLAGAIDPQRGWGLSAESWRTMEALNRFAEVRPPGSQAGSSWFNLGDQDLATHLYRTARLAEGALLSTVSDEIARSFGLELHVLPMSDDVVRTMIDTVDEGTISFQEYFVRRRHDVAVSGVHFAGAESARLSATAEVALSGASAIIVAPSNPLVSIGPIRSLGGVDDLLARRREQVVAISPIVGGAALKGPADRMMRELGHEPSVVGVARLYAPIATTLIIDPLDAALADAVAAEGIRPLIVPSVMSTPEISANLASAALRACLEG